MAFSETQRSRRLLLLYCGVSHSGFEFDVRNCLRSMVNRISVTVDALRYLLARCILDCVASQPGKLFLDWLGATALRTGRQLCWCVGSVFPLANGASGPCDSL